MATARLGQADLLLRDHDMAWCARYRPLWTVAATGGLGALWVDATPRPTGSSTRRCFRCWLIQVLVQEFFHCAVEIELVLLIAEPMAFVLFDHVFDADPSLF
jgi:hypothetical protein